MNGIMSEINWIAGFRQLHPKVKLEHSVPTMAKWCCQWYPRRYQTVLQYAIAEYTCEGHENTFRWKYVSQDWFFDQMLGIDYLYRNDRGSFIGLDLTLNPNLVQSKASKHYGLRGIFDHLGITPYVLLIGQDYNPNEEPTLAGISRWRTP